MAGAAHFSARDLDSLPTASRHGAGRVRGVVARALLILATFCPLAVAAAEPDSTAPVRAALTDPAERASPSDEGGPGSGDALAQPAPATYPTALAYQGSSAAPPPRADLSQAISKAYAPLFFDNQFGYVLHPDYDAWFPGDRFKQLQPGCCWLVDVGGQYRARYQGERNIRGLGLTGRDDDFLLHRTRLFISARYDDWFRVYTEYLDAESNYENFAPRAIEVNRSDLLNLFADARLWESDRGQLWFRIGRQELLYGSERLISPLDWANTRRTFEGLKFYWQGEAWNVDVFATRPVIVDPLRFDSASYDQEFFGGWATYKAVTGHTFDLYAVQYNNDAGANRFRFTTLGGAGWPAAGTGCGRPREARNSAKTATAALMRPVSPREGLATNGRTVRSSHKSGRITTGPAAETSAERAKGLTIFFLWLTNTWAIWTCTPVAISNLPMSSSPCSRMTGSSCWRGTTI